MFGSDFLFTLSIRNNKTLTFKNKSVLTQKRADSNLNVETDSSSCILKLHFSLRATVYQTTLIIDLRLTLSCRFAAWN